ncbi:VOC family protein [Eubacteriales bacterium OttesenSCG-928-A19]|nr:VOC family protein [Eubacteriales bacterium OttesenSCG-928-A19]
MITRIGHPAIRTRDIEESARFYREILGMKEAFRMYNGPDGALGSVHMFVAPGQYIELFPDGVLGDAADNATGYVHMCYEVDNAEEALAAMRAKGAPIDVELKRGYSRCIQFWTHDPDGNRIELMELPPDCLQVEANRRIAEEEGHA